MPLPLLKQEAQPLIVQSPSAGWMPHLPQNAIPDGALSWGRNILFDQGEFYTSPGAIEITNKQLDGGVMLMFQRFNDSIHQADLIVAATEKEIRYWNPNTDTLVDITPTSGYDPSDIPHQQYDHWDEYGDTGQIIFSTGIHTPVWRWTGVGRVEPLPGLVTTKVQITAARTIRRSHLGHCLLGYVRDAGKTVASRLVWSDLNDPEMWESGLVDEETGQVSEAGYIDVFSSERWHAEGIREIQTIRDYYYIYTGSNIVVAQYVGLPLVWVIRIVHPNLGASRNCVGSLGHRHIFRDNRGNTQMFNGADVEDVGLPVRDYLNRNHKGYKARCLREPSRFFIFYEDEDGPGYPREALSLNVETGAWSTPLDFPATCTDEFQASGLQSQIPDEDISWQGSVGNWNDQSGPWVGSTGDSPWSAATGSWAAARGAWVGYDNIRSKDWIQLIGGRGGKLFRRGTWTRNGNDYTCYADTKLFDVGDVLRVKALLGLHFYATKLPSQNVTDPPSNLPYDIEVYLCRKMSLGEPDVWEHVGTITLDTAGYAEEEIDLVKQARYFKLRFQITSTAAVEKSFAVKYFAQFFVARGLS